MYALRQEGFISRELFNKFRTFFASKITLSSEWITEKRIEFLSGVTPVLYDCCINSCMAYTGDYLELETCRYCSEPRLGTNGKPQRQFSYLPIIPDFKPAIKVWR